MKKIQYKIIIPASALLLIVIYSCSKSFLNKAPIGTVSDPTTLANKNGVDGLLLGAYSLLDGEGGNNGGWGSAASNWVYGSVCADDAYKGSTPSDQGDIVPLETWSATATNSYPAQKWDLCYDGVQRANDVLRVMRLATDLTSDDTTEFAAEAHFLRGFYLFELKKVFNNVPFIDESITSSTDTRITNVDGGSYVNIWPQIEAEFTYAIDNLPTHQDQVGRANKGAAMAYLAKVYMFQQKYQQAKPLLDALVNNTNGVAITPNDLPYNLSSYENNFNSATKNGPESVFAAQMSVNDGSGNAQGNSQGVANGNFGDVLNFPYNNGPGACCGFFNPSQSLANAYKTDANGLPLLDESYNTGKNVSDKGNLYAGTLDPRIDWVMGRPGLPYFDWGSQPADDSWLRDPGNDGRFTAKKNVYAKSQKGTYSSTENYWANTQLVANNVNLIRFSDILLWAAECDVELGTDVDMALEYVNRIRNRAADKTGWVYAGATYNASNSTYSPQTTPADNYFIKPYPTGAFNNKDYALKAIRFERRLELAMEGHRFFDLVRWGIAEQTLNAYATFERAKKSTFNGATFTSPHDDYFLIPQSQIDILNSNGTENLKQNP